MSQSSTVYDLINLLPAAQRALLAPKSDADFEVAFESYLSTAIDKIQSNSKNFKDLDEVGLSAVLASALEGIGIQTIQEGHSNGHVDITILATCCMPQRKKLAEAKIWGGAQYHTDGVKQLLGRYTTGSEGRGLLIVYVKSAGIKELIGKARKTMDKDLPFDQTGAATDLSLTWSFLTKHKHSSGEVMEVGHIGCNLHAS